ncbi:hypothetical protein JZ751_016927 [Albula glossodonta]|uniref:Histidine ammonia-lyase n=1 Tax=Albula glossodonta TaxID=121402 RepID=A0A8T2MQ57_9TELE|nr:hypothetical protein JZ751_016927 [Albula glossodonta]
MVAPLLSTQNIIWQRHYSPPKPSSGSAITLHPNHHLAAPLLSTQTIIWQRQYSPPKISSGSAITLHPNHHLAVPLLSTQTIIWQRHYSPPKPSSGSAITLHPNHHLAAPLLSTQTIIWQRHYSPPKPSSGSAITLHPSHHLAAPLLSTQTSIWQRHYSPPKPSSGSAITVHPNHHLAAPLLSTQNIIWQRPYSPPKTSSGSAITLHPKHHLAAPLLFTQNIIWQRHYSPPKTSSGSAITLHPNQHLAAPLLSTQTIIWQRHYCSPKPSSGSAITLHPKQRMRLPAADSASSFGETIRELQDNLIRSHAAGVGSPLSPERTRMLLALRINILAKGHSGVSLETLHRMVEAFNASCLSYVPERGTVGASGDLAPLAHLALGLMGEGNMWSLKTGWAEAKYLITALGAEAVERAQAIARQADVIAALTLQVLKGTTKAFDSDIHAARPHPGQVDVAWRLRSVLDSDVFPSEITVKNRAHERVQDAYSLRCCPQVHGVANDTIAFVKSILTTEMNSATDNPLVFGEQNKIVSGGNFHGEYPAKALDFLSIGVHELASISERRIERLCNPSLSELPAFLVTEGGLNSGFMIAHCTAAALVSENKVLCHPSSVDSLSTSAATEDHVSMGGWAARKALRVVEHVEQVLAIELLAACQALEFHRPLKTTPPLEAVYQLVRMVVRPWDQDRVMSPDIQAAHKLLQEEKVWEAVVPYMEKYSDSLPHCPTN